MPRILIYSHNVIGLGHVKRAIKIAHELALNPSNHLLVVSGSSHMQCSPPGSRWEIVKLPTLYKDDGIFHSAVGLDQAEIFHLRSELLLDIARSFDPDLLVVHNSPRGLRRELQQTLDWCRQRHIRLAFVARDIFNSPELTISAWTRKGYYNFIDNYYDIVVHQGQASVFNAGLEYKYQSSLLDKVVYSGYLLPKDCSISSVGKGTLVTIGGGRVGYDLFFELLDSPCLTKLPVPIRLLPGPLTSPSIIAALKQKIRDWHFITVEAPQEDITDIFSSAAVILHNGGYNTTCEVLATGCPTYVLPRHSPLDQECRVRANRLDRIGALVCLNSLHELVPCRPNMTGLVFNGLLRLSLILQSAANGETCQVIKNNLSI